MRTEAETPNENKDLGKSSKRQKPQSSNDLPKVASGIVKSYNIKTGVLLIEFANEGVFEFHAMNSTPADLLRNQQFKPGDKVKFIEDISSDPNRKTSKVKFTKGSVIVIETNNILIQFEDDEERYELTPKFLSSKVAPFLEAIASIQKIINKILGRESKEVTIKTITHNSPISVSLAGAAEATEIVRELIVPWRKEHAEKISKLEEQEKQVQIEAYKAEILEKRAHAAKERSEAKKVDIEVSEDKIKAEIERMYLENEKLRIEIQEVRITLALTVLEKLANDLPETLKISYVVQLLEPLGIISNSSLQIYSTDIE